MVQHWEQLTENKSKILPQKKVEMCNIKEASSNVAKKLHKLAHRLSTRLPASNNPGPEGFLTLVTISYHSRALQTSFTLPPFSDVVSC